MRYADGSNSALSNFETHRAPEIGRGEAFTRHAWNHRMDVWTWLVILVEKHVVELAHID